jgi:hypothetical protein
MLKLTLAEEENRTIYISAKSIQSMNIGLAEAGTFLALNGIAHWVRETPEQILAMDEMIKELNPLFYLPSTNIVAVDQEAARLAGYPKR